MYDILNIVRQIERELQITYGHDLYYLEN